MIAGDAALKALPAPYLVAGATAPMPNGQDRPSWLDSTPGQADRGPVAYHDRWNCTVNVA
jgi:hypothetical protein